MQTPPLPANEDERIRALHSMDILDTPPEERFDRLTRMARRLFDVPIALVSLVDRDRQWFKSCMGLNAKEGPRSESFCGHAILGNDVFVVPDAQKDDRFADNPNVTGDMSVRFYAGAPLTGPNDHRIGTLCIIDDEPRTLEADDIEALEDLAAMVEDELAAVQMATMDAMTDVANRRGFAMLAKYTLAYCTRKELPASLVYLDLDKFKPINDNFGHAEGDRALRSFADVMKQVFRDSDVLARLGGDEFAALLPDTSEQQAVTVVARFKQAMESFNASNDRGYEIQFSDGVVEFDPSKHESIEAFMSDADRLMYEVKRGKSG